MPIKNNVHTRRIVDTESDVTDSLGTSGHWLGTRIGTGAKQTESSFGCSP